MSKLELCDRYKPIAKAKMAEYDNLPADVRELLQTIPMNLSGLSPNVTAKQIKAFVEAIRQKLTLEAYGPEHPNLDDFTDFI